MANETLFKVGFLGYGKMARSVSEGLAESRRIHYGQQMASGRSQGPLSEASASRGIVVTTDNRELVRRSEVVVLGVKPNQVEMVLDEVRAEISGRLVISMAAGLRLATLRQMLPEDVCLVRTMPNIAALVGRGVTLMCALPGTPASGLETARDIFESVGACLEMNEGLFDAGTAISGSGPAYFFTIMEALTRGAIRLGIPWETAKDLVIQTAAGSAAAAEKLAGRHFAELRDMVSSPGGSTIEGMYVLEQGGLTALLMEAVAAAEKKNQILGQADHRNDDALTQKQQPAFCRRPQYVKEKE